LSIALVTLAFKLTLPSTSKFVLVALCDSANDQGECYPSVSTLMAKCSLSDRGVQRALTALEADGYVRRELRNGRSTVYWITPNPRPNVTPDHQSPPTDVHPSPDTQSPPPPTHSHPTPERQSPITVNEPSIEPSVKQKKVAATDGPSIAELVNAGMTEQTASDFIAHKARLKAPLTQRAWADHQREARKAGWTVHDAAEKVMAKHWKGFEAKYVQDERGPTSSAPGRPPPESFRAQEQRLATERVAETSPRIARRMNPNPTFDYVDMETPDAPRLA
jgi:DNA-binding transcriptional MocR family regulator